MSDSKLITTTTLVGTHVCISEKDHDLLIMAANTCKYTEERTKQLQAQVSDMSEVVEAANEYVDWGFSAQNRSFEEFSNYLALKEALSKLNSNTATYEREDGDKVKVGLLANSEADDE